MRDEGWGVTPPPPHGYEQLLEGKRNSSVFLQGKELFPCIYCEEGTFYQSSALDLPLATVAFSGFLPLPSLPSVRDLPKADYYLVHLFVYTLRSSGRETDLSISC